LNNSQGIVPIDITLIEPFFTGSHAAWATEYAQHSQHNIDILSLSGNYWKWRMHGGAVTLARKFLASGALPDLLLVTDMLDLTTFLALTRHKTARLPVAIYFHENQICYPWSTKDRDILQKRDHHYGFINYSSALAADLVVFNSTYHQTTFFDELPRFLKQFPDLHELDTVATIQTKSCVLHLGLDLQKFDRPECRQVRQDAPDQSPLILWNHRWEYDKNPEEFFQALFKLDEQGLDFRVAILGEHFRQQYPIFETACKTLGDKIVHYGYVEDFAHYAQWLHRADIIPMTSRQEFFGASLVEALYCGCYPLLPNRLTYPELLPQETYPDIFYRNFDELVEKLAGALLSIETIRQQSFRHCVEQYSWQHMAPAYDLIFGAV
jgi:glycosyltransferase involved in cell wall biosynthesis